MRSSIKLKKLSVFSRILNALYDNWFVHCVVRQLDSSTREQWHISQEGQTGFPKYKDLVSFLERRIQSLEQAQNVTYVSDSRSSSSNSSKPKINPSLGKSKNMSAHAASASDAATSLWCCSLCKGQHYLYHCEKFKGMTPSDRFDFSKQNRLCLNCLSPTHNVKNCHWKRRCFKCKCNHHTQLHFDSSATYSSSPKESQPTIEHCIATLASATRTTLLATARVTFVDDFGNTILRRALIDPGAERSFVTTRSLLNLPRRKVSVAISSVGAQAVTTASQEVSLTLRSSRDNSFRLTCSALLLPKLTGLLPSKTIATRQWPHLRGLEFADPDCFKPAKIDFILGADVYLPFFRKDWFENHLTLPSLKIPCSGGSSLDQSPLYLSRKRYRLHFTSHSSPLSLKLWWSFGKWRLYLPLSHSLPRKSFVKTISNLRSLERPMDATS